MKSAFLPVHSPALAQLAQETSLSLQYPHPTTPTGRISSRAKIWRDDIGFYFWSVVITNGT